MNDFSNIRTDLYVIFDQFSVVRKQNFSWRSYLAESPLVTHNHNLTSESISDLCDDIDYKCQRDTHAMVD